MKGGGCRDIYFSMNLCHIPDMSQLYRPRDTNQLAKYIVDLATGAIDERPNSKDPTAVERGRKAGTKGGKARALSMTPSQHSAHGRKMASARWANARS